MLKQKFYRIWIAVIAMMIMVQEAVLCCPNCKEGFTGTTSQAAVGEAYSWTIYLLIMLPWVLVGLVAYKIIKTMKRKEQEEALVS